MKKQWFESPWIILFPLAIFLIFPAWYTGSQYFLVDCKTLGNPEKRSPCKAVDIASLFNAAPDLVDPEIEKDAVKGWKAPEKLAPDTKPRRQGGKFVWMFIFIANVLCAGVGWLIALMIFNRYTRPAQPVVKVRDKNEKGFTEFLLRNRAYILGLLTLIGGFIIINVEPVNLEKVYEKTIEKSIDGIANFSQLTEVIHSSVYTAILALLTAMCVLVYPRKNERVIAETAKTADDDSGNIVFKEDEKSKKFIRGAAAAILKKRDALNGLLYVSTTLLVLSVIRLHSSLGWTLTFMSAESVPGMKIFFENFATVLGGFFTLLLASTYIPIAYIVNSRGRTAQRAEWQGSADAGKKTAETDFKFSFNEAFPKILAIIAPLLTGPLAEFFKNSMPK